MTTGRDYVYIVDRGIKRFSGPLNLTLAWEEAERRFGKGGELFPQAPPRPTSFVGTGVVETPQPQQVVGADSQARFGQGHGEWHAHGGADCA